MHRSKKRAVPEERGTIQPMGAERLIQAWIPETPLSRAPGNWSNILQERWHNSLGIYPFSAGTRIVVHCSKNEHYLIRNQRMEDLRKDLMDILQITITIIRR